MDKIIGTNLGNWLVLEKWMQPFIFQGTGAEDETWLNRNVPKEKLWPMMKQHRDTYVTEEDFNNIASHGLNTVRIPVPYFIFGDREPYSGCIEYLDKAFEWAEKYGLKVLVDLHTAPGCQNSYDNGGLMGVCKWSQMPDEVRTTTAGTGKSPYRPTAAFPARLRYPHFGCPGQRPVWNRGFE